MFWTLHLIGWLFPCHLILFLEFWSILSFGTYFFVLVHLLHFKGWSLRYSPGWGNPHLCVVVLYVGEGSDREQCHLLGFWPTSNYFPCYPKATAFWCWFLGGWFCVCSKTSCVLPTDRPVRLGVSPIAATLTGCYNQSLGGFISTCWNPGLSVCLGPQLFLPVYPHANVGLLSLPAATSLTWSTSHCLAMCPFCPGYPSVSLLPIWMNVSSLTLWLSGFHTVHVSGSSLFSVFKLVVVLL